MSAAKAARESKTMNHVPEIKIEYVADTSGKSAKRSQEAADLIFQMMLLARKRGRPSKNSDMEELDAA